MGPSIVARFKMWLKDNDRTPAWAGRKLKVSSTLVYFWLSGKRSVSDEHLKKMKEIMK